jgi:catechol 2,3-dioxygenase-like lactoylglutathione lyase family enzyme
MISHVSVGVSDIKKSGTFYDAVMQPIGYKRLVNGEGALAYGDASADLWLLASKKPVPAEKESGLHFCFTAKDRAGVDAFHAAALKNGGADNGKPGVRADYSPTYYAAFVVDPDGYRLEAFYNK